MSAFLPVSPTSLLGRETEITFVRQHLQSDQVRLLTITGPGGVGKTSLALQVALESQDSFPDGVFFISLAAINSSTLIIPAIAHALGLSESPDRLLLDRLKEFLCDRQVLLLLDNFEQVISAAPLLGELLSSCSRIHILATSREALRLRAEQEFPLMPLALPAGSSPETLAQAPAVALFLRRACSVQPDFRLTEENASAVSEICARLDGLPLALELAASHVRLLPPAAMLAQLRQSSLDLLTGGPRDTPFRQHTLRAAVRWSYNLLDDVEQRVFRNLSVFVGGVAFPAALRTLDPPPTLQVLDSLVNKSLLRQVAEGAPPRFTMLETIRAFGLEQLDQSGGREDARRAHAEYFLSFAEEAGPQLTGPEQKDWFRRLEEEQDNLRLALEWILEHRQAEFAQRLAGALQPFWLTHGYWTEGRRWLEDSLSLDSDLATPPLVRARALYGAGILARFQGDFARARMLVEESLATYRTLDEKNGLLLALVELGRIADFQADRTARKAFIEESASLLDTLPDTAAKAYACSELATSMVSFDRSAIQYSPRAVAWLAESVRINRLIDNPSGLALALIRQASGALFSGDFSLIASQLDEAEHLALEIGDERIMSRLVGVRVLYDLHRKDFTAARHRLDGTIQAAVDRSDHQVFFSLFLLSAVLHWQALDLWSARVLGFAQSFTPTPQTPGEEMVAAAVTRYSGLGEFRAEIRAILGSQAFNHELAAGRQLSLADLQSIPHPQEPVSASDVGPPLTVRETEVLRLLSQDLSNPQIAGRLVLSRRTVDAHLRSIYDKLGVRSRDSAVRVAAEKGLL